MPIACGNVGVDCTGPETDLPPLQSITDAGLPAGWSIAIPCAVDNANRVLADVTVQYSSITTPATCAAMCAEQGLPFAGVEYSDECYCGTGFTDGVTPPTADATDCNMRCAGNYKESCGGSWRMQIYTSQ